MYIKREAWGYSLWLNGKQIGAGLGLDPFAMRGILLTRQEWRVWFKRGLYKLGR